jgi:UDP-N-acetylmuramoyl-L-alanyl-D-glutamate--2,6-diaminopimelate ligase
MNARLVWKISELLSVDQTDFCMSVKHFPPIPGRMQEIKNNLGKRIIVDFAHTPNGLKQALTSLQQQKKGGKLIAVYGSAGLRDVAKRPMMGQIGTELADQVVFTAEDPRTENVWTIIRQMKENLTTGHHKIHSIPDRFEAISFAIKSLSKSGDIILIAGKGHEQSICYGKKEYSWNDVDSVKSILNHLGK